MESNKQIKSKIRLTDAEFWSALRENGGIFSRTAKYIQRKYKISYSRQSVRKRATSDPEQLEDIIEEALDIAEEGLQILIRTAPPNVRLQAIQFFLKAKGKGRGYGEKPLEISATAMSNEFTEGVGNMSELNLTIRIVGNDN